MEIELLNEKKLVSSLLKRPERYQDIELNPKHFEAEEHSDIVQAIINAQGKLENYYDIIPEVKIFNPFTKLDMEVALDIFMENPTASNMEQEALTVKKQYLYRKVNESVAGYQKQPTERNYMLLAGYIKQVEEMDQLEDAGFTGEVVDKIQKRFTEDLPEGLKTFATLDMAFNGGIRDDKLIVIGARPAVGKTAFALNMAQLVLKRNRNKRPLVDIFSLEMSKLSVMERLYSISSGLTQLQILRPRQATTKLEKELLIQVMLEYESDDLRVFDRKFTLDGIVSTIRKRSRDSENYIAIIDYLQLISVSDKRKNTVDRVTEITQTLKRITGELNVPIILITQLNRSGREDERPELHMIRDSGSVEQDANAVIFLHNEKDENGVETSIVTIAKNREGRAGEFRTKFDKQRMTFKELFE